MTKQAEQAVLVTTEYRGVFFGYMSELPKDDTVKLLRARNCVYWSSDVKGFLGLAANGPNKNCKVGPAVPSIVLAKITAIVEVEPKAAEQWEKAPWA